MMLVDFAHSVVMKTDFFWRLKVEGSDWDFVLLSYNYVSLANIFCRVSVVDHA